MNRNKWNNTWKAALVLLSCLATLPACNDAWPVYEDYDYTTVYFPFQYPVRTLILGESDLYDVTTDHNHQFIVNANVSGVYENKKDVWVDFEVDESLTEGLFMKMENKNVPLKILPAGYYDPIASNRIIIPKKHFRGGVTVQLTDAFFEDPVSYTQGYVLPLRILDAATDSILFGKAADEAVVSPLSGIARKWGIDPRNEGNWTVQPKNFTMFVVKYINKYHGSYLRRGVETSSQAEGYGWEKGYIEKTPYTSSLKTAGLNRLVWEDRLIKSSLNFSAYIEVGADNSLSLSAMPGSEVELNGNGRFVPDTEEWGGKKRYAFYLDYQALNRADGQTYAVKDTLVFWHNGVKFEEYGPIIVNN